MSIRNRGDIAKYSLREQIILNLLKYGAHQAIATPDLMYAIYGHVPPLFGREATGVTMRDLMRKVLRNNEGFIVRKSNRRGPHPLSYWLERRR